MKNAREIIVVLALLTRPCLAQDPSDNTTNSPDGGKVTSHPQGLHGYIGFGHEKLPVDDGYTAGMGFYAAVWPLVDQPLADFQIGLPSSWIQPDNSDNKDQPLAPEGTLARQWKERGPTWSSVFQTVEGGLGYWAGNQFRADQTLHRNRPDDLFHRSASDLRRHLWGEITGRRRAR